MPQSNRGGPAARPHATAKHTPGPWRWRGNAGEDYAALVSDVVGGPIIQTTHDVDPENPNAVLIAAAPEQQAKIDALVAALEDARDVVRIAQVEGSDHGDRCRGLAQLTRDATRCMETIRTALRLAGRLS